MLALPLLISEYYVGETTWVFIYAIGGISLMVLVGYTGLVSLGHAAFLGIGAYAHAFFLQHGMPWVVVGGAGRADHHGQRPRRRPAGAAHDRHLSRHRHACLRGDHPGGVQPLGVGDPRLRRHAGGPSPSSSASPFDDDRSFYYLCLFFLVLALWLTRNLLRSPTGRAWIAIRDSEIAAQSMGVNLAIYKSIAFAYSAALMGLAGALFAHKIAYLAPDIFTILLSIQFLLLVIVGGLGSLHGAVFGAIFVALLPPVIAILRDSIPDSMAEAAQRHRHRGDRRAGRADRQLPQEARRRGRHLRPDPGAGDPARAARHLRALAQDQDLLLDLPDVQGATFKRQKSYMRSERLR